MHGSLESELSALQIHFDIIVQLTTALMLNLTTWLLLNIPVTANTPAVLFNASAHPGVL